MRACSAAALDRKATVWRSDVMTCADADVSRLCARASSLARNKSRYFVIRRGPFGLLVGVPTDTFAAVAARS